MWRHYDGPYEQPDFWTAMASVGVTNGTPLTYLQTFYDDGTIGNVITFGNATYSYLDTRSTWPNPTVNYSFVAPMEGPIVQGPLLAYFANFLQFDTDSPFLNPANPPGPLQVGDLGDFRFGYSEVGRNVEFQHGEEDFMTLTAIVPEANTLWFLAVGLTLAIPMALRRRAVRSN